VSEERRHPCVEPLIYPRRPSNRPGLGRIAYRIGTYCDIREALFRKLNQQRILAAWTHRDPDDPGIALLEGAAILGDILTFYQEHYANEAFLRTAQWRESISDLVRLVGYRLSPAVGGHATFAFELKGDAPVTIPAGFRVKADLEQIEDSAEFETEDELIGYPHLSRLHLYRERQYTSTIPADVNRFEVAAVGGAADSESLEALELKAGDRLLLMPDASMWDEDGTIYADQQAKQIVIVENVEFVLGRLIITIEGSLQESWTAPVTAFRLGRTYRHFGYQAPPTLTATDTGTLDETSVIVYTTRYERYWYREDQPIVSSSLEKQYYADIPINVLPLDQEVDGLPPGGTVICEGFASYLGQSTPVPFIVARTIAKVRSTTLQWANNTGPCTLVEVNTGFFPNTEAAFASSDIRDLRFHEVIGEPISLRPTAGFPSGAFSEDTRLYFYGTQKQAKVLAGRRLVLTDVGDRAIEVVCTNTETDFVPTGSKDTEHAWMWPVSFDRPPDLFEQQDFDESEPTVTVFGNLVDTSQGKSEDEVAIGSGDSRQAFQTFKVPKGPLTYHLSPSTTPPEVPELEIYVDGRKWERVPYFYGHSGDEQIYIVREDANGDSYVQFGNGETGARLPSGLKNVVARYRTGVGARGPLKPGSKARPVSRQAQVEKLQMPLPASGGSDPEDGNKAREAGPGKIQSLGRLVSLRDYETETLQIPGVTKVSAAWALTDNAPLVKLTVLMEAGRGSDYPAVRDTIQSYQQERGPDRFPVETVPGSLRYVYLSLQYGLDPTYLREDVEAAIRTALGTIEPDQTSSETGLFGLGSRRFGGKEYVSRIEGTVQNVSGVRWVKVAAAGRLPEGDDPKELRYPTAYSESRPVDISCAPEEVLQLYRSHLHLYAASGAEEETSES
jgi:hypothetical protein